MLFQRVGRRIVRLAGVRPDDLIYFGPGECPVESRASVTAVFPRTCKVLRAFLDGHPAAPADDVRIVTALCRPGHTPDRHTILTKASHQYLSYFESHKSLTSALRRVLNEHRYFIFSRRTPLGYQSDVYLTVRVNHEGNTLRPALIIKFNGYPPWRVVGDESALGLARFAIAEADPWVLLDWCEENAPAVYAPAFLRLAGVRGSRRCVKCWEYWQPAMLSSDGHCPECVSVTQES